MNWDAHFTQFVVDHSDALYRTAYAMEGSAAPAADLVQETLTALYPQWSRVMAADSRLAYVRKAMVNRFLSNKRRLRGNEVLLADLPDAALTGSAYAEWDERDALIRQLSALPPRQRAALVMHYLHDLDDHATAEALGCRVSTVRSLIRRGLATLRGMNVQNGSVRTEVGRMDSVRTDVVHPDDIQIDVVQVENAPSGRSTLGQAHA